MKFIIVLITVFSVCHCFSDIIPFFGFPYETNGGKLPSIKQKLSNNKLSDEEILRCQYFMYKMDKDFDQRSSQAKFPDNLSKCNLLLQKGTKFPSGNNDIIDGLPPSEYYNYKDYDYEFIPLEDSTSGISKEENSPNTELYETSSTKKQTDESKNPSQINTSWSIWTYLSSASGSSDSSSSALVTKQNDASKTEKQSGVQTAKYDTIILSPIDSSWSLWGFLFSPKNFDNSSKENRSEKGVDFQNSADLESATTEFPGVWNIVLPGTKWCGAGSAAKNDDDLGYFEDVDKCCRAHDKCSDLILPGETKYNLTNTSPFTILNCNCDDELYDCLTQINSVAANTIGNTYFNIFGRMCYTLDYPKKCKNQHLLLGCVEYEDDTTAEKVYQWKQTKKYLAMPF